jgi:hypothetical protein
MTERARLAKLLRSAMETVLREQAGLPRVTIYDRPKRGKAGRRQRERVAARLLPSQMELL